LSANQGYSIAQFNLGLCYEKGEGVEKNISKAIELYTLAAKQGNEMAIKNLNRIKATVQSDKKDEPK